MESNGSEGFRSVIDDLTIENQQLKRKLRQYEAFHSSHLEEEKLFEVRIHGLPQRKKRELEDTLRRFVSTVEPRDGMNPAVSVGPRKPTSLSSSAHKVNDSAYASMSVSGRTSTPNSNKHGRSGRQGSGLTAPFARPSVSSYHNDIKKMISPKRTSTMSETARAKMVVEKLEQLFKGKVATSSNPPSSRLSSGEREPTANETQASKQAKRRKFEKGMREARMLPTDADLQANGLEGAEAGIKPQEPVAGSPSLFCEDSSGTEGIDQRPTRPNDLDPRRAQVPADNMEYIRHLGCTTPIGDRPLHRESGDGWVYLNLLTSMAQLHTLNVTPGFVRKAVARQSSNFELSSDGQKVRWTGSTEAMDMESDAGHDTKFEAPVVSISSGSIASDDVLTNDQSPMDVDGLNLSSSNMSDAHHLTDHLNKVARAQPETSNFHYKPLFSHPTQSSCELGRFVNNKPFGSPGDDGVDDIGLDSGPRVQRRKNSMVTTRSRKTEHGPIIFYHNAEFCTDLCGDSSRGVDDVEYSRYLKEPLGSTLKEESVLSVKGPLSKPAWAMDDLAVEDSDKNLGELTLLLHDMAMGMVNPDVSAPLPKDLEASGLGGVHPEDNFSIQVQVQHERPARPDPSPSPASTPSHGRIIPRAHTSRPINPANNPSPRKPAARSVKSKIIAVSTTKLPPSNLPPPSYTGLPFSSSDDGDDEDTESAAESDSAEDTQDERMFATSSDNFSRPVRFRAGSLDGSARGTSASAEARALGDNRGDGAVRLDGFGASPPPVMLRGQTPDSASECR